MRHSKSQYNLAKSPRASATFPQATVHAYLRTRKRDIMHSAKLKTMCSAKGFYDASELKMPYGAKIFGDVMLSFIPSLSPAALPHQDVAFDKKS